jgi:hypothetical protein
VVIDLVLQRLGHAHVLTYVPSLVQRVLLLPWRLLASYVVMLASLVVVLLPSFFTLLILRSTKTEAESKVGDTIERVLL